MDYATALDLSRPPAPCALHDIRLGDRDSLHRSILCATRPSFSAHASRDSRQGLPKERREPRHGGDFHGGLRKDGEARSGHQGFVSLPGAAPASAPGASGGFEPWGLKVDLGIGLSIGGSERRYATMALMSLLEIRDHPIM